MCENSYNGYKNYETWNVALWLDNTEGDYIYMLDQAMEVLEDVENDKDDFIDKFADMLQEYISEFMPEVQGMYADLLQTALDRVDWYEIAENWYDVAIENS